jgi:MFS family permease
MKSALRAGDAGSELCNRTTFCWFATTLIGKNRAKPVNIPDFHFISQSVLTVQLSMFPSNRMSAQELRASISLSGIFGLRMLGMFVILPVFAIYAERLPGGDNLTLVGVAIGAYGLTQAVLQIPFGAWSDRYGRKPVIYAGLLIFAAGSFVAAAAPNIYIVILGRVMQGAGAISAAVMAMAADLTRDEHRTKVMAMIGSTIGATFALSLVASPWLNKVIGVPGIFALTGVLALAAMAVVYGLVPDVRDDNKRAPARLGLAGLWNVLRDAQMARLYYGVFALHALLMALFIAVPFSLRDAGLALDQHWKVYLPVMLGSFALMLPAVLHSGGSGRTRNVFIASVALLLLTQLAMPWFSGGVWLIAFYLLLFFTAFNILEASLPSLVTRMAPAGIKGTAIGVFSSLQFFGTFLGAVAGGFLYGQWGVAGVVILDVLLLVIWLGLAFGMKVPPALSARTYSLPKLGQGREGSLLSDLRAVPGVHEALVNPGENMLHLRVDSASFDEQNVLKLIAGEI